jgi:hypothetical protein
MYEEGFDERAYERTRQSIPYEKVLPHVLRAEEEPLRAPELVKICTV